VEGVLIERQVKTANILNEPMHSMVYMNKHGGNMAGQIPEDHIAAARDVPHAVRMVAVLSAAS
jgi:hypothetical protein